MKALRLNQIVLSVSDLQRAIDFYQGVFGMPLLNRGAGEAASARLRIGPGPQSLALVESKTSKPSIVSFGMSVDKFDAASVARQLNDLGVPPAAGPGAPLSSWTKTRAETRELFASDPDGLVMQLQDASYCGGSGPLGNKCSVDLPRRRGLIQLHDLSHFTIRVADAQRSRDFYQKTFGMGILAHQGDNAPILGVGNSRQFVMSIAPGAGRGTPNSPAPSRPAAIDHGCFLMDGFQVDRVFKFLGEFGLKPRGEAAGPAPPLVYYVSLRMPNRGGAPAGTEELYFTDPDGIVLQIQDTSYCGGGGSLGSLC